MFFGFVCLCLSVFLKLAMSKIKLEPGDLCKPEYIQIFVKQNFVLGTWNSRAKVFSVFLDLIFFTTFAVYCVLHKPHYS